MADSKTSDIKEMADKAGEHAKNIWLAGLGAYGKVIDEAQGTYHKVSEKVTDKVEKVKQASENNTFFEELVEKGKKLESETQGKFTEVKEKANETLEDRLAKVKDSLSFNFKTQSVDAEDTSQLLDEISAKLDLILSAVQKKPAAKPATRKASTRKAATSKTV